MGVVIVSRPSDFASAYVPVEYTITSGYAGVTGNVGSVGVDGEGRTVFTTTLDNSASKVRVDGKVTLSNTVDNLYDGEWTVLRSTPSGNITIDAPYVGVVGQSGSFNYSRLNAHVLCDLYVDGSFVVRKKRFSDSNDQFVFNYDKEVQVDLGNDMKPMALGVTATSINPEASVSVYVIATEYADVIDGGVATTTAGDTEDDSANAKAIINSTVPYLEWSLGSTRSDIINKDTDLTDFVTTASSTARFLTNSPKTITIGESDGYELSFIVDYDAAIGYSVQIKYYNAANALVSTIGFLCIY